MLAYIAQKCDCRHAIIKVDIVDVAEVMEANWLVMRGLLLYVSCGEMLCQLAELVLKALNVVLNCCGIK